MLCGKLGMLAVNIGDITTAYMGLNSPNLILSNRNIFQLLKLQVSVKGCDFHLLCANDFENIMN